MKPYLFTYKQQRLETDISEIRQLTNSTDQKISDILEELRGGTIRQLIFTPSGIAIGMGVAYWTSGTNPIAVPALLIAGLLGLVAGYVLPTRLITKQLRLRAARNTYWIGVERNSSNTSELRNYRDSGVL